jgi:uncharacterized protein (DUF433 family)
MEKESARIGEGIYTAADASRVFKIPYTKTKYWFSYYAKNKLSEEIGYQYHFSIKNIVAVNFLTLIEMYVFFCLKDKGLKTSVIVNAHTNISKLLNTPYPFAKQDLYTNGKDLLFGIDDLVVSTDKRHQVLIWEALCPFFEKITYGEKKLALKFYPLGQQRTIVVNPENQFGQPIIDGTNILSQTISSLYAGGESIQNIKTLYNITDQNVVDALDFANAA